MNNRKWMKFLLNEEKQEPKYEPNLSLIDESIFDSLDLTHLSESQIAILMEGRKENVVRRYGEQIEEYPLEAIINFDEQYRFKHLQWMARELASYSPADQEELVDEVVAGVESFTRFGRNLQKKDINQYPNLEALLDAIQQEVIQPRIAKAREKRLKNPRTAQLLRSSQGTVVYEDERYFVVRPDSTEASCHFGAKTRWCIAQAGNSYFSSYTQSDARVFYFIKDDTKKNEDYNYKMAVEVGTEYNAPFVVNVWDRFDEQYEVGGDEQLLTVELVDSFGMPQDKAANISAAIFDHAEENPPESPLADLNTKIENGEYDGGFVTISSYYEDYDEQPYLSLSADVRFRVMITNPDLVQMLMNDEIDIEEAEDKIRQEFYEGEIREKLEEEVDIGASKYWYPEDEDQVMVEISATAEGNWYIDIAMEGMTHDDHGGTFYGGSIQDAEEFCKYMHEEWGERNTEEILESLGNHIFRFIPEFAARGATRFRELRNEFTSGRHDIEGDTLYYTVDDDENENSDLNLFMNFRFEANPEYIDKLYMGADFENASGNIVRVAGQMADGGGTEPVAATKAQDSMRAGIRKLKADIGATRTTGEVKDNLGRAIYNVYNRAYEFATRQLKLDFGEEWNSILEDQWELPQIPEDISIDARILSDSTEPNVTTGTSTIIPSSAYLKISFAIYIPFHKSEAELDSIYKLFMFIKDNYDAIAAYIHKYTNQYQNFNPNIPILAENLLYRVLESKLFLEDLNNELKRYNKRRKQR